MKNKICMVVQDKMVKGGIAAVISGYYGSKLEEEYDIVYVESYRDGGKVSKFLKGIQGYICFLKVLLVDRPKLVHVHSSFGTSFYRKIPFIYMASMFKIPIINHIHGADFDTFYVRANDRKKKLIQQVYSKCTRFIALSDEWKDRLSKIIPEEKITVIHNYSVLKKDAVTERVLRKCANKVLFLGEIGRRKGGYDIPEIVKKVAKQIPEVMFILAGVGSKEDETAIRKMIEDLGIADNVMFPGWVRNQKKEQYLKDADIFFLPSYNEGMPMSILDAMGYGMPIVSTYVGGIPKLVFHGENGYLFTPGDTDGMADGIVSILEDEKKRIQMAEKSAAVIEQGYSLEQHIMQLIKIYSEEMRSI